MSERLAFDPDRFATAVRQAMDQRAMSRDAVAEATGLSEASVRRAQNGLAVSADTLVAMLYWMRQRDVLQYTRVVVGEDDEEEEVPA